VVRFAGEAVDQVRRQEWNARGKRGLHIAQRGAHVPVAEHLLDRDQIDPALVITEKCRCRAIENV
jgi:predicted transcriptional regulator